VGVLTSREDMGGEITIEVARLFCDGEVHSVLGDPALAPEEISEDTQGRQSREHTVPSDQGLNAEQHRMWARLGISPPGHPFI
jgi:hypothetical protein